MRADSWKLRLQIDTRMGVSAVTCNTIYRGSQTHLSTKYQEEEEEETRLFKEDSALDALSHHKLNLFK